MDTVRDTLNGGSGTDAADYSAYAANLSITLNGGSTAVVGGSGPSTSASDTLANIENFIGGSGNDTITGDGSANVLSGGSGNDTINGAGGNDTLEGGAGDDTLNGGAGSDTLVFKPGFGNDTINQFGDSSGNQDIVEFSTSLFASFSAVQAAMAQQGADVVITVDASNRITLKGVALGSLDSGDFRFVA